MADRNPKSPSGGWIARVGRWVEGPGFQRAIITLIILNGVSLGLETSATAVQAIGPALRTFDAAVLAVFVFEIGVKLAYRRSTFFRDGWNVFDFLIVAAALIPASGPLAVLRGLRILRVLRLLSVVPQMRRVVGALLAAIPGLMSVGAIIVLVFYVGAVLSTKLFGAAFPEWFGTIGASMYTLFQIMTLESWSMGIVRPVMDAFPYAWLFFVPFIVATSFAILNLFIGIIVDAMQVVHQREQDEAEAAAEAAGTPYAPDRQTALVLAEVRQLRREVAALRAAVPETSDRAGVPPWDAPPS
ncbi:ion transporter [Roseospira marina]|uniref:Ion transporter n=1 Tax=Roseospira marina TaxID=140057 RepID=A0A5M6IGR1_9PROT|nr:ion transporter [Roseospira marina]KAA5607414.1 ion transporter [Roseospira marina]MBB4312411.1 voltage-gated sodium channel [Roseospira marina]MBB5085573.1 voltage-gated sodium channel [Roseospira marina]